MKRNIIKKILLHIMCIVLVFTQIHIENSNLVNAAEPDVNLLTNGNFSDGMTGWDTYIHNGSATVEVDSNHEMNMTINWWAQESYDNGATYNKINWQAILIQKLDLKSGTKYTVRFDAKASEARSIQVVIKGHDDWGGKFNLTTEKQTIKYSFTAESDINGAELQFLLGYVENGDYPQPQGKNTVYISNVFLVEGEGENIVITPDIIGVEDNGEYVCSVTPEVNYNKSYNAILEYKKDIAGEYSTIQGFAIGDTISENGYYKLTIADADDSSIATSKEFSIDTTKIDLTKDYYIIKSRATGKVLEAIGYKEESPIVQSTYDKKLTQLFSLENAGTDNIYICSLTSEKVIGIKGNSLVNSAKIVQQTYSGSKFQQWTKVFATQGYVSIKNIGSGKVIDVPSASSAEGLQMAQYSSNNSNAQHWDIIKVDVKEIVKGNTIPDTDTEEGWKKNVIIAPSQDKLIAAGPIYLQWYNNKAIGAIEKYEIQFDSEDIVTVSATDSDIMEYEWYNTKVSEHKVTITAVLNDGTKILSDARKFYVSKKGVGWGSLYRTDNMNVSWYYNWSMEPTAGTDENLQFVPMIWGNWGSSWLANSENKKYKTVLAFNEPDFTEQSNVSVDDALAAWPEFMDSGLRLGSPCTAIPAYWSTGWFWKFMDGINADESLEVDFIAIHCYLDNANADTFLKMIDETWEKWHKPIWITEFGVAEWNKGIWNSSTESADEKVYSFMKTVLPELDKREYVERYAWFPFDPTDKWGGASGIFNYDNGKLNNLGKLYANLGVPEGYSSIKYDSDDITEKPAEKPTEKPTVKPTETPATTSKVTVKKPKKAVVKKLECKKKKVKITVKKQKGIKGFEVRWSTKKSFKKSKKMYVKNKKKITVNKFKKLKKKTKYYFKVRAYVVVNKKKYFGKYSNVKKVIVK